MFHFLHGKVGNISHISSDYFKIKEKSIYTLIATEHSKYLISESINK